MFGDRTRPSTPCHTTLNSSHYINVLLSAAGQ